MVLTFHVPSLLAGQWRHMKYQNIVSPPCIQIDLMTEHTFKGYIIVNGDLGHFYAKQMNQ